MFLNRETFLNVYLSSILKKKKLKKRKKNSQDCKILPLRTCSDCPRPPHFLKLFRDVIVRIV